MSKRPSRWGILAVEDERQLLSLAGVSSDVGHTALGALTHLPLRAEAWIELRSLLLQEVALTDQSERRIFLEHVLSWMPDTEPVEVAAANRDRHELEAPSRGIRDDLDYGWIRAPAPGFVLDDVVDRQGDAVRDVERFKALVERVEAYRGVPPFAELSPLAVTAIFDSAATLGHYRLWIRNALVAELANNRRFTPDLVGLFSLYRRAVAQYSAYERRPVGPWLLEGRDNENGLIWLSWHLAWTASRGGVVGLVAGMMPRLASTDAEEQIAALLFIADAADYCVQQKPELFGGGGYPPRLGRDDRLRVLADPPPKAPTRRRRKNPVQLAASAPRRCKKGNPFVVALAAYTKAERDTALRHLAELGEPDDRRVSDINASDWLG